MIDRPVTDVVREIARRQLRAVARAAARLGDRTDAEALHDFRVAIRRLRSTLRAWRPWAGRAAARKVRRRWRDLGRRTNPRRDAEVQIAWLDAQRDALARSERAGLNRLIQRLRRATRRETGELRRDFARAGAMLTERLEQIDRTETRFGEALADLLATHARAMAERVLAIEGAADVETAHDARIHVKRLRYLVEPVAKHVPEGATLVRRLKRLQAVLGDLHDAHVMDEVLRRDERPGLAALAALNRERRDKLFASLDVKWLRGNATALAGAFQAAAESLRPRPGAPPTPLPQEIERKYLLTGLPPAAGSGDAVLIEQGWLPGEMLQERLRRIEANGAERRVRTVKLGTGVTRTEVEEEAPREVFETMWPLTRGRRVRKRRYRVPANGLVWEVDEFLDRDLVLAEVELPSATAAVTVPEWLEPYVEREVTDEAAYVNVNLAQ